MMMMMMMMMMMRERKRGVQWYTWTTRFRANQGGGKNSLRCTNMQKKKEKERAEKLATAGGENDARIRVFSRSPPHFHRPFLHRSAVSHSFARRPVSCRMVSRPSAMRM